MYIKGELKDASFAVIEDIKRAKFRANGKQVKYTLDEDNIQQYSIDDEFFNKISWMDKNDAFTIHFL